MKEQSKKIQQHKRSQQIEREKQAQILNDAKKQEGETDEMVENLKVFCWHCSNERNETWLS